MYTRKGSGRAAEVMDLFLLYLTMVEEVRAVGRLECGSLQGHELLVVTAKHVPKGEERLRWYRESEVGEARIFDVSREILRQDVLLAGDARIGLTWAGLPEAEQLLKALSTDYNCDEFLPGTLSTIAPAYDPDGVLEKLRRAVPAYPAERAVHRVRRALQQVQTEFTAQRGLEQAAMDDDPWDFVRHERELLEAFVRGLFALNRRWYWETARMLKAVTDLQLFPTGVPERFESILLHQGMDADLAACYDHIRSLFDEFASLARQELGNRVLPAGWV